ncbi:MAG: aminopeptidase [Bacteroidales bacterium]|nr:aminopeptidase [Bacteroidales bacterium]
MKRTLILAFALLALCASASAQQKYKLPEYTFTTVKENPITSVKNQFRSGTCWAFSTVGLVESEVIRINKIKDPALYPDFSDMFVISKSYQDRADKYVRLDGNLTFASGSEADDVLDVIREYGIVPQCEMEGLNYGTDKPVHGELDSVLKSYVESVAKNPNGKISTAWKKGFTAILDSYLGECPEKFTVDGKEYTPASYRDALNFNPDDYISLTSFTHHPFYTWFAVEICDNWRWDRSYNIPIDEIVKVVDNAIEKGYTLAWGTDVSAPGFTRDGLAVLVDVEASATSGSDQEHWLGKDSEGTAENTSDTVVEKVPTQESRQIEFDEKTMTDDHGMQIYGIAKDQFGKKYYMVKNSWGVTGKYSGIWYATEAYLRAQTLDITVHKSALTPELKKRLGIK